jgi:hypothetical protein
MAEVAQEDRPRVQLPEVWTPEQVEQFREVWDSFMDLFHQHQIRIIPEPVQMIVLHYEWDEDGTTRQETYGPWYAAADESHLELITAFMRDWERLNGHPSSVTMALVTDPATVALACERKSSHDGG